MARRTYNAWEQDGKFYLSFFPRGQEGAPRVEFATREDLEQEIVRRGALVKWSDGRG